MGKKSNKRCCKNNEPNKNEILKRGLFMALFTVLFFLLSTPSLFAQQGKVIIGKVTDSSDLPLPGVTVVVKGITQGTVTNTVGEYSLSNIPENATLVFSFVGMRTMEVVVGNQATINIRMEEATIGLNEVVAVGYGTQKKVNLTGSLSSVSTEKLEGRPLTNVSQVLAGTATGIQVTQNSGQPGQGGTQIRIRGIGTLTDEGQNPLIIVDGIAVGNMNGLNPNDIENITVLKDAASSAIYGSRAANGVILITTKKGKVGKTEFNYHGYYGVQKPTRLMSLVTDMTTHMELINEAKSNLGRAPQFPDSEIESYKANTDNLLYPNTNWHDVLYGTISPIQNHNVSVRGGNENSLFNISIGYLGQEGIDGLTSMEQYNFHTNNEIKLNDRISFNSILSGFWQGVKGPSNIENAIITWGTSPGVVVTGPDGKFGGPQVIGDGNVGNPLAELSSQNRNVNSQSFLGKLSLNINILDGLDFQTNGAIKYDNSKSKNLTTPYTLWNYRENEVAMTSQQTTINLGESNNQNILLTFFNTLNFEKDINNHYIKILVGQSIETYKGENFSGSIKNLFSEYTPVLNAGIEEPIVNGNMSEWGLLSFFSRLNYMYKNKYLFEANLRRDASSKFKKENRWGTFPSFSFGWRITEEQFFPKLSFIDDIKLRASWGKLGNQNIGSNYPYQAVYNINQNYNLDGAVVDGAAQTSLANEKIKWETTTTSNAAMDVSLFNNRLFASFDYFSRLTDGILAQVPIPITMGNKTPPFQNIASVKNWGWELAMDYHQTVKEFSFNIGLNISQVENKVVKYKGDTPSISGPFIIKEGLPYQSIYGYKVLGIFQTETEVSESPVQHNTLTAPGDLKYEDYFADGKIDANDRQVIGNTIPKYNYGLNFDFSYKNFDLNFLFQGILKVDRYLQGTNVYPIATNDRGFIPTKWLNRWTVDNPSEQIPRITINGDYPWNYQISEYWMQDGSFLRLKNIQLGYNLPNKINQKLGIGKTRLYLNAQNLLTFTSYEGYDPETMANETTIGYPLVKIMSVGLQLNF